MRKLNAVLFAAAVVLGATASADALARGGHGGFRGGFHHARVGVFIGAPLLFAPFYYPYSYYPAPAYYPAPGYYYPAPAAAYPSGPATYVEQGQEAAPAPRADASWYYCPAAKAYYPYVSQCAGGWQRVSPQPPPS
jgi:hypothetical protein